MKSGELFQGAHCPSNHRPVIGPDRSFHQLFQCLHPFSAGCLSPATFLGQFGEDDPSVARVECPPYQTLRLQAIYHLGDIRPDAIDPRGQLAEWNCLAGVDQVTEHPELRDRELNLAQGLLNPVLKPPRQLEQGEQSLAGLGPSLW